MNIYCSILTILTAVFAGLLVIDVFTTTLVLNMGGTELNPLMAGIANQPWLHILIKTLFAIFVVILACRAEHLKQHSGAVILIAACSMFLVVAVHNIRVVFFAFLG
ncbi:DUF5658 family protein [Methanolacinia paynteri]|uniref:DUF5658 family protein n=1 Tax=Methanolacinia paynteri TaxID=230356 RepID=UPI00064E54F5|nr:DUF5658 family protein [Methanolacinia paynteri]